MPSCLDLIGATEYPSPSSGNMTIVDIMNYGNYITCNSMGFLMLIGIFVVMFVSTGGMYEGQRGKATTTSMFITAVAAILLAVMGTVSVELALVPIVLFMISIFIYRR